MGINGLHNAAKLGRRPLSDVTKVRHDSQEKEEEEQEQESSLQEEDTVALNTSSEEGEGQKKDKGRFVVGHSHEVLDQNVDVIVETIGEKEDQVSYLSDKVKKNIALQAALRGGNQSELDSTDDDFLPWGDRHS